ncbi:MAG: hypothetical protein H6853_08585 [Rhodospirillales bacterium]|nr:hypothetical protein [Alphaproteobacteria bacterium]USO03563.1 MAG: hypothetical protein H6853_08585 [Rhodospirillales bacterium]
MADSPRFIVSPNQENSGLRVMDMDGRYALPHVQKDFEINPSFLFVSESFPFTQPDRKKPARDYHYIGVRVRHPVAVVGMLVSGRKEIADSTGKKGDTVIAFDESVCGQTAIYRQNKILAPGDLLLGEQGCLAEGRFVRWYGLAQDDLQASGWQLWRRCFEEVPASSGFYQVSDCAEGFWEQQESIRKWPDILSRVAHRDDIGVLVDLGKMKRPLMYARWAGLNP